MVRVSVCVGWLSYQYNNYARVHNMIRPGKLGLLFLVSVRLYLYFRHLLQHSLLPSNWRHAPLID